MPRSTETERSKCPQSRYLLGDVPEVTVGGECQHPVFDGDIMEVGSLFVAQESVGRPDLVPAVVAESDLGDFVAEWRVGEARVGPRLAKIHAHHIVLSTATHVAHQCRLHVTVVITMTGQFAEKPTCGQSSRGLDNSRIGELADSEFLKIMELLYSFCTLNLTLTLTLTLSNIGSVLMV